MLTRIRTADLKKYLPDELAANLRGVLSEDARRWVAGLVFLAWTAIVLGKYIHDVAVDPPPSMVAAVVPYPHLWLLMILAAVGVAGTVTVFIHTWGRPISDRWRYARLVLGMGAVIAVVLGLRYHPGDSAFDALGDLAADDSMLLSGGTLFLALGLATYFGVRRLLGLGPLEVSLRTIVVAVGGAFLFITVLAGAVIPVLGVLWICLAGWLIGDAILNRFFPVDHLPSHERTLLALGLGLGVMAQALFFPGIAGLLYKWPILTALATVTLLRWRRIVQAVQTLQVVWHDLDRLVHIDGVIAILGGLTVVVALVNFIAALAPEFQSDAVGMHLALPKLWIQTHRLQTLDRISPAYWTMHNLHMLYTVGMLIHSAMVAKPLHYSFGLLDLGLIYGLGRRIGDQRAGLFGAIVFYVGSTATVWWESGTTFVDLAYTFYTVATVLCLMTWLDTGQRRLLVLTGMMGGLGAGVKVLGGLVFFPALIVVALYHLCQPCSRLGALVVDEVVLAGAGLLSNSTWLAFAELNDGTSRFWPALTRLLRLTTQVELAPITLTTTGRFGIGTNLTTLLQLPWLLTFQPELFRGIAHFGPALLVLGITLLLRPQLRYRNGYLLIICLTLSYLWAVTGRNLRYALPVIALWSILSVAVFVCLIDGTRSTTFAQGIRWSFAATVMMGTILGFQFWHYSGQSSPGFPYLVVFGLESEKEYLSHHYRLFESIAYLNESYGDEAHVLAPFNRDNFYPQFILESWAHATLQPYIRELFQSRSPTALRQRLRAMGFTHLVMDQADARRARSLSKQRQGTPADSDWLDQALPLEFAAYGMYVYRVPAADEPIVPPSTSPNRLNSGGFEQELSESSWQRLGSPHIDRTGTAARAGAVAALVDLDNKLFQRVAIQPGRMYQLSLYARRADPDAWGRLLIQWVDEASRVIREGYLPFQAEETYTRYSLTEVAPAGAAYAVVYVVGLDGRIWVDDVAFVERLGTDKSANGKKVEVGMAVDGRRLCRNSRRADR